MNCAHVRERLSELHDGQCQSGETEALRQHLAECPPCSQHYAELEQVLTTLHSLPSEEPSPKLRENFAKMLADEIAAEEEAKELRGKTHKPAKARGLAKVIAFPVWYQLCAAACLVLVGVLAGTTLLRQEPVPSTTGNETTQKQLADLQKRLESMSELVAYSLSRQQPDNARLQRVAAQVGKVAAPSSGELAALVGSLAFDPSTNVRLSALEALYPHAEQTIVREGVIASLPRERSVLVQLAMIDFLSSLHERQANKAIEALIHEATTDERVRDAGRRALAVSL